MVDGITTRAVVLFLITVAGQVGGIVLVGRTQGFTQPLMSLYCAAAYAISIYTFSLLIKEGAALTITMPLLSAVIPIGAILLAMVTMGEPVSWTRLAMLITACIIVAVAGNF